LNSVFGFARWGRHTSSSVIPCLLPLPRDCSAAESGLKDQCRAHSASLIAAHNEETAISRRLQELKAQIAAAGVPGEIIVVSDGSTDGTAALARSHGAADVHVVESEQRLGKAAALTTGCAEATGEILIFADARQTWAPDALRSLLQNFRDPAVGAVSGNLMLESSPGVPACVGLYWRYEKWLRAQESRLHSLTGVTGAISAVRRELFRPIPHGTLLDDVYWPLQVTMQHRRVVFDEQAVAYDRLPERADHEFRRKVRTLCGNLQLLTLCPAAFLPWRNPVWFQLISHKLLRLATPWALLLLLVGGFALPGPDYRACLALQIAVYLLGFLSMQNDKRHRPAAVSGPHDHRGASGRSRGYAAAGARGQPGRAGVSV
jgi:cellulose synthase/poly-beta-1,6-N-acetylglucosamine synthase-like glycosyltransferase